MTASAWVTLALTWGVTGFFTVRFFLRVAAAGAAPGDETGHPSDGTTGIPGGTAEPPGGTAQPAAPVSKKPR